MTSKKNTQKSPVILAEEYVKEVESSIASLAAELDQLQTERDQLAEKTVSGNDLDRLADLQDTLIPRRVELLKELRTVTLPDAVAAHRREELLILAADGVEGIEAKYADYQRRITEAEEKAAQALAEAREAVAEWGHFIGDALAAAQQAGQDQSDPVDPDHPVRVIIGTLIPEKGKPTHLIVNGETYQPTTADRVVRAVAVKSDPHVAEVIRLGVEEMTYSDVRRGRWS